MYEISLPNCAHLNTLCFPCLNQGICTKHQISIKQQYNSQMQANYLSTLLLYNTVTCKVLGARKHSAV